MHAHKNGLVSQYCHPVIRINTATGEKVEYIGIKEAAETNGVHKSHIAGRYHGKYKSAGKMDFSGHLIMMEALKVVK